MTRVYAYPARFEPPLIPTASAPVGELQWFREWIGPSAKRLRGAAFAAIASAGLIAAPFPIPSFSIPARFYGFETGDGSEFTGNGGTIDASAAVINTRVLNGGYSLKLSATDCTMASNTFLSSVSQWAIRFTMSIPVLPGVATNIFHDTLSSGTFRLRMRLNASNNFELFDQAASIGMTTTAGTFVPTPNVPFSLVIAYDNAVGGIIRLWVNDVLDIDITHTLNSGNTTTNFGFRGAANPNEYMIDNIALSINTVLPPYPGIVIARQGIAGTPTNDAWAKSGAGDAAGAWSDSPFNAGTNCNSSTSSAAQTMLIAPFSKSQSGHGGESITPGSFVWACKTGIIAKRATAGNPLIRHRLSGVNTDLAVAVTASDNYFEDTLYSAIVSQLDSMEAGVVKAADANLTTVEDVWVHVYFLPAAANVNVDQWYQPPLGPKYPLQVRAYNLDVSFDPVRNIAPIVETVTFDKWFMAEVPWPKRPIPNAPYGRSYFQNEQGYVVNPVNLDQWFVEDRVRLNAPIPRIYWSPTEKPFIAAEIVPIITLDMWYQAWVTPIRPISKQYVVEAEALQWTVPPTVVVPVVTGWIPEDEVAVSWAVETEEVV